MTELRIGCLGWGSLIWDIGRKGLLPLKGTWSKDGPMVHVEFLRQSQDDRITLVLHPAASPVPSMWAIVKATNLTEAVDALSLREGMPAGSTRHIGFWAQGENVAAPIVDLPDWAATKEIDAVIWTALPPKFRNKSGIVPTIDEVVDHLRGLGDAKRSAAEEYISRAPRQIATPYRAAIEAALGWRCCDPDA